MPQIIVIADRSNDDGQPRIMFRERVSVNDFESQHFANQLVERIGWAVGDADEVNRRNGRPSDRRRAERRPVDAAHREPALNVRHVRPAS